MTTRDRQEFNAATKRAALDRASGQCEGIWHGRRCLVPLGSTKYEFDHVVADWFSGMNDLENCAVLCKACHAEKTDKRDKPAIAKTKRIIGRANRTAAPKGPPMPGTRRSGWKKTFSGGWVKR